MGEGDNEKSIGGTLQNSDWFCGSEFGGGRSLFLIVQCLRGIQES